MFVVYWWTSETGDEPYDFYIVNSEADAQELILTLAEEDLYQNFLAHLYYSDLSTCVEDILEDLESLYDCGALYYYAEAVHYGS